MSSTGGKAQRGITLIEVMVAIVVLSIGLLGMAGLQAATAKYQLNTLARSSTSILISDLSERIRVNPDVAGTSFVQGVTAVSEYVIAGNWSMQQAANLTITKNCDTAACTASERATFDLLQWRTKLRSTIPQGAALLEGTKRDGFIVTMMWMDKEQTVLSDNSDASSVRVLKKAPICNGAESGMAQQSCCPNAAEAVVGVRCARFSFVP